MVSTNFVGFSVAEKACVAKKKMAGRRENGNCEGRDKVGGPETRAKKLVWLCVMTSCLFRGALQNGGLASSAAVAAVVLPLPFREYQQRAGKEAAPVHKNEITFRSWRSK